MGYGVSARSYLERAKQRLFENSKEALFYAAFELRCSVEARQAEYMDAMKKYIRTKKARAWEVSKNQKRLENAFRGRNVIVKVRITNQEGEMVHESYYTPVQRHLANHVGKLGNYLHAMSPYRGDDDPWWLETRSQLIKVYKQVWISCRGNMMAPPLLDPATKLVEQHVEASQEDREKLQRLVGQAITATVEYLDTPPDEWKSDL